MEKSRLEKRLRNTERDNEFLYAKLVTEIGFQIEDAIELEGITQTELAARMGVSKSYITRILNGQPNMTIKTLVKVANALNRRVETQFGEFSLRTTVSYSGIAKIVKTYGSEVIHVLPQPPNNPALTAVDSAGVYEASVPSNNQPEFRWSNEA